MTQDEFIKKAKEIYGDKIETKAGDIYKLPFKDNEFDGLMMVRVTHHLKHLNKANREKGNLIFHFYLLHS